jgi:Zn-dependent peptidase ImmA (M78 family)
MAIGPAITSWIGLRAVLVAVLIGMTVPAV